MTLTRCRDCDKQISTDAAACPNCGAPPSPKGDPQLAPRIGPLKLVLIVMGILAFIGALTSQFTTSPPEGTKAATTVPPPGLIVNDESVLTLIQVWIRGAGKRCDRINDARLWAMSDTGGTFIQVQCDGSFWYAVHTNADNRVSKVETLSGRLR